jgi:hypothetical protein
MSNLFHSLGATSTDSYGVVSQRIGTLKHGCLYDESNKKTAPVERLSKFQIVARLHASAARRTKLLWLFDLLWRWQQAFTLQLLACKLAGAAHGFSLFAGLLDRWLFVSVLQLHFTEDAFTLQLLLQNLQGLINIVVANDDLQETYLRSKMVEKTCPAGFPTGRMGWPIAQAVRPVEGESC